MRLIDYCNQRVFVEESNTSNERINDAIFLPPGGIHMPLLFAHDLVLYRKTLGYSLPVVYTDNTRKERLTLDGVGVPPPGYGRT